MFGWWVVDLRRSSRSQMFFKIGVLKNFPNFTGKYLCWRLFLISYYQYHSYKVLLMLTLSDWFLNLFHAKWSLSKAPENMKNLWFSDMVRSYRKRPVAGNGLSSKAWISIYHEQNLRYSVKKGVLINFTNFTGKHLCLRLQHRCFPLKLQNF